MAEHTTRNPVGNQHLILKVHTRNSNLLHLWHQSCCSCRDLCVYMPDRQLWSKAKWGSTYLKPRPHRIASSIILPSECFIQAANCLVLQLKSQESIVQNRGLSLVQGFLGYKKPYRTYARPIIGKPFWSHQYLSTGDLPIALFWRTNPQSPLEHWSLKILLQVWRYLANNV